MDITERIKHLAKKSSVLQGNDNELFLPKEVFRRIIDRERSRANRTGEVFSLVVFVLPESGEKSEILTLLADTLSHRVRAIDAVGWLDAQHVGVLLPETDSAGAHVFANKIHENGLAHKFPLKCEVFTYPSEELTDPENSSRDKSAERPEHEQGHASHWGRWYFDRSQRHSDYIFSLPHKVLKRAFDVLVAGGCLIILSPLFLAISVFIKIVSPGPVFFKQQRVGYGGHPFTFLKFRTMCPGAKTRQHQDYLATLIKGQSGEEGADAPMTKLDHDPQIIPGGNLLRKSCMDELPQLINVLRGEMSLVGPRPPIPYEVKEYYSWHRGRFDALPGMTGLWQVSGKNKLSFREMVRLDIRYTRERSLWMDVKILFRTPLVVLEQFADSLKNEELAN